MASTWAAGTCLGSSDPGWPVVLVVCLTVAERARRATHIVHGYKTTHPVPTRDPPPPPAFHYSKCKALIDKGGKVL